MNIEQKAEQLLEAEKLGMAKRPAHDTAVTVCMASVKAEPLRWLWAPRFALGKLSIIAGDPGLGKSMLTASMSAHVSTGRAWPDGGACPTGSVVLVSAEDDPADTIRPRLDAAGANVNAIHYLQAINDRQRGPRGFNLADVGPLADLLDRLGDCKLVIIDPLSAYLGDADSHRNAEIRALLAPLASMAAAAGAAIVAVTHLNKSQQSAMYRMTGSLAFVAAARAAYCVVRDKDDQNRRLMLPVKNNLGPDTTGMAYAIREDRGIPYVQWERDPVSVNIEDALAPSAGHDKAPGDAAAEFLSDLLGPGPVSTDEVKTECSAAGISWSTVRRAKDKLGVRAVKVGFGKSGRWSWQLPSASKVLKGAEDAHINCSGTLGTLGAFEQLSDADRELVEKLASEMEGDQ